MLLFQFFYYSRTTRRALRFSLGITGDGMATHLRGDRCALFPAVIVAAARLVNIITSWFLFAAASFFLSFFPPFYDPGLFSLPRCVTLLDRALSLFLSCRSTVSFHPRGCDVYDICRWRNIRLLLVCKSFHLIIRSIIYLMGANSLLSNMHECEILMYDYFFPFLNR